MDQRREYEVEKLQQYLVDKYEAENKYWENPVYSEEDYLSEMYVQPSVKFIREINQHGQMIDVQDQKAHPSKLIYKDIFKSKYGETCKNIYITGDTGTGKSTFCNRLVLNWCSAVQKKTVDTLATEDQELLSAFRLLFRINLRNTETAYHVEEMIQKEFFWNAPVSLNISDILKSEKCLVVLDGLDEWACPLDVKKCPNINKNIPGRNTANTNSFFITTTRSWKYDVIAPLTKDVDKHVELGGLESESVKELTQRVLHKLNTESIGLQTPKKAEDFYSAIEASHLGGLLFLPVLLIQLITLWFFGKDFQIGNSHLQLHCSMLELMFERSEKNLPEEITDSSSTAEATSKKLPECFSTKDNCQKYAELLHCLSKLAYKALFNKQKEESLVFKSSKLEIFGISPSNIKLCLHCGILSQCKDYGNRIGKYKRFSFLHKMHQEFLAALYIATNEMSKDMFEEISYFCNSLESTLEMSRVWVLLSGICPYSMEILLKHFTTVIGADRAIQSYRQTLNGRGLIQTIQLWVSDCIMEGKANGNHYKTICFEDFYIKNDTATKVEPLLLCTEMSKVKSMYVDTKDIGPSLLTSITSKLQTCKEIQNIYLEDRRSQIHSDLVAGTLQNGCSTLTHIQLDSNITATDTFITAIFNSNCKYLMLFGIKVTHGNLIGMLNNLSARSTMEELRLSLSCIDHVGECRPRIDLSKMKHMQSIELSNVYVENMHKLSPNVEKVCLVRAILPLTSICEFANAVSQTQHDLEVWLEYTTLTIDSVKVNVDLKTFLETCGMTLTKFESHGYEGLDIVFLRETHETSDIELTS